MSPRKCILQNPRWHRCWLALLLVGFLGACSDSTSQSTLRVGMNNWVGYGPMFLGSEPYRTAGYRVIQLGSTTEVLNGLRHGTLEAGALTLDEALTLAAEGIPLEVVLVIDVSNGGDAVLAKPGTTDARDLMGRNLAVEDSAVGGIMLHSFLAHAGLSRDDMKIHYCAPIRHPACFDRVDALITFEPMRSQLLAEGAVLLFDSTAIPDTIVDVLVVRADKVVQVREGLRGIIRAHFQGLHRLDVDFSGSLPLLAAFSNTSEQEYQQGLQLLRLPGLAENQRMLAGSAPALKQIVARVSAILIQGELLPEGVEPKLTLNGSYLQDGL